MIEVRQRGQRISPEVEEHDRAGEAAFPLSLLPLFQGRDRR